MGGYPYWYFARYQPDINTVLQDLRQHEFAIGRYYPAVRVPFDFDQNTPLPGAQHSSIEAALEASHEIGTRSILDISRVSDSPDICVACPLPTENLLRLFDTDQPTRLLIESVVLEEQPLDFWEDGYNMFDDFWDVIGRGESRYIIVYDNGEPSEIFFVGYSSD